jgi:hypothetical protein
MANIGEIIEQKIHDEGQTVTWFAGQLCCTRSNAYKIFHKGSIDSHQLRRISEILHYDFFNYLSNEMQNDVHSKSKNMEE